MIVALALVIGVAVGVATSAAYHAYDRPRRCANYDGIEWRGVLWVYRGRLPR